MLILTLMLVCQNPAADIALSYAQEEFVFQCDNYHYYRLSQFDKLGDSLWKVRERASKDLLEYYSHNVNEIRWLFWGRHSKDPEIALRCNTLLKKLSICQNCHGKGQSQNWYEYPCNDCDGIGTYWGLSPWN